MISVYFICRLFCIYLYVVYYRLQPDMGCRKISIRIILCAYNGCLEQLDPVWKIESKNKKQRRYKTSNRSEIK